ncbi:MAG: DUF995 domain-containing protein [Alphaproteobacteria bacterium]|nr:DUF995 domain-containing protein [Alphaproteobacteria bacterium]
MKMKSQVILMLASAFALSACTGMNVFKDSSSPSAMPAPPAPAIAPEPITPMAPTALSSAQIKSLLSGKSWAWTGPKNSGVTLYASDGTSLVQVNGKGTTSGKWQTKDGQLCESFSPASFMPQGLPMNCQSFSGTSGNYRVGQASFKIAS